MGAPRVCGRSNSDPVCCTTAGNNSVPVGPGTYYSKSLGHSCDSRRYRVEMADIMTLSLKQHVTAILEIKVRVKNA